VVGKIWRVLHGATVGRGVGQVSLTQSRMFHQSVAALGGSSNTLVADS
jgi:hypothetical protein